jgi:hypothetical protein
MLRRRLLPAACFILLYASGPARADEFSEFRIPDHGLLSWTARLLGHYGRSLQGFPYQFSQGTGTNGELASFLSWLGESDPSATSVGVSVRTSGSRSASEQTRDLSYAGAIRSANRSRLASESLSLGADHRRYFELLPVQVALSVNMGINDQQSWSEARDELTYPDPTNPLHDVSESDASRRAYSTTVSDMAGIGVGRIRDATGLYEARVMEDRLRAHGVLSRDLTHGARQRLADLMFVRSRFDRTVDRPARILWGEISRILAEDGAVEGDLSPNEVLRLIEPFFGPSTGVDRLGLPRSPIFRGRGTEMVLFVRDSHTRVSGRDRRGTYMHQESGGTVYEYRTENLGSYKSTGDQLSLLLNGGLSRPLGLRWQVDASESVALPARPDDLELSTSTTVGLSMLITDRWLARGSLQNNWMDATRTRGPTPGDRMSWSFNAELDWFLEDATIFGLTLSHFDDWSRIGGTPPSHSYTRNTRIDVSLTHRFFGRFDAPGLLALAVPEVALTGR